MRNFSTDCKLIKVSDPTTAGTSDVTSAAVDMAQDGGFGGVIFFSSYGTAASGNKPYLQGSDDDAVADAYANLAGTEVGVGASDEDVYADMPQSTQRYVKAVFQRGTSSTLGDIWAILYDARKRPVVNNLAGTILGEMNVSPAEGTK